MKRVQTWGSRALAVCVPLAAVAAGLKAAPPSVSSNPPLVADAEHRTLYNEAHTRNYLFYRLGDGTLYVQFSSQPTASHMDIRRVQELAIISTDNGRTWRQTDRREVNPQFRSQPGRLVEVNTHNWRYASADQRAHYEAQGIEVRNAPENQVAYSVGAFVRVSADGGETWQQRNLDLPPHALIQAYRDDRAFLRLDERTILRATYGKPVARVRYYEAWALRSEDDGETWTFGPMAAQVEKDVSHGETALAQAANGDIVAMMRTEPANGTCMWVCWSSDRGKTWSEPIQTPLLGHPAHLLRLRDGRLLCTYGIRDRPIGIRACISRDHGRTWRAEDIMTVRTGEDFEWDSGYPITLQADDGTLLTVYYLTRQGKTGIELTRWSPTWK